MANIVCKAATTCTEAEVGPFMQGISSACGNTGNCTLTDIMSAVANIGNWILGIIALIVFVVYVYGGIKILMGGARAEFVKEGKTAIKTATIGLVIVFVANLGLTSIKDLLQTGSLGGGGGGGQCTANTLGNKCGDRRVCTEKGCEILCDIYYAVEGYQCSTINKDDYYAEAFSAWCKEDQCPDGKTNICCNQIKLDAANAAQNAEELEKLRQLRDPSTPLRPEEF